MINVGRVPVPEIASQLAPGEHVVVFHGGMRLFLELDGVACDQLGPLKVLDRVYAVYGDFEEDHPLLGRIIRGLATGLGIGSGGIPVLALKLWKSPWLLAMRAKDPALYAALGTTAKAGGIITLYVAAYIAIRWTQLMLTHRNSRDGGVLIEFGPPYWPLQVTPTIWPRGGPKPLSAGKIAEGRAAAAVDLVRNAREKAAAARQSIPRPARSGAFGRG